MHVHWVWLKTGCGARLLRYLRFRMQLGLARLRGWSVLVTVHNLESHDARGLDRRVDRDLLRLADGFITHDEASRRALESQLPTPRPIAVIPHPSYRGVYGATLPRAQARAALGIPREAPLFLFMGQLRPYKGVDALIEAFSRHAPDPARLLIAGRAKDPRYAQQLEEAAAIDPRITLRQEFIPDSELPLLFGAADWVALPFRTITTSGSAHLALSFGRPVIAPRHEGLLETLGPAAEFFDGEADLGPALLRALARDAEGLEQTAITQDARIDHQAIGRETVAFARSLLRSSGAAQAPDAPGQA